MIGLYGQCWFRMQLVSTVIGLGVLAGCGESKNPEQKVMSPAAKPESVDLQKVTNELDRLIAARPFVGALDELPVHTPLRAVESESNDYFQVRRGQTDDKTALFRQIEVRIPTAASEQMDGILILDLAPEVQIRRDEWEARSGVPTRVYPPRPEQPDGDIGLVYQRGWGELRLAVENNGAGRIRRIVLDATQKRDP